MISLFSVAILPNHIMAHFGKETTIYGAAMNFTKALFSDAIATDEWKEKMKSW